MDVNNLHIAVRRRGASECVDLALLLCRRYWWQLILLTLVGVVPMLALCLIILQGVWGHGAWYYLLMVLSFAIAPLAVAPLTAFLGTAMFSDKPRLRESLKMAYSRFGVLLAYVLLRLIPAWLVIGMPFVMPHFNEAFILERLPFRRAWNRVRSIERHNMARQMQILLISLVVLVSLYWMIIGTSSAMIGLFTQADIWGSEEDLVSATGYQVCFVATIAVMMPFMAVLRFCSYIDYRIRSEGWDVELELRRAGQRLVTSAVS